MSIKDLNIRVSVPSDLVGSSKYSVSLEITNIGKDNIRGIVLESINLPGALQEDQISESYSELDTLHSKKRRISEEMSTQAEHAFLFSARNRWEKILYLVTKVFFEIINLFSIKINTERLTMIPPWGRRSLDV